jgi:VIT1/CCC1 family predicted Fe2+/Mn2+ transporter
MFIGAWLLISPFVMGYEAMKELTASNMLAGVVLIILGLGVIIYNAFDCEKYSHPNPTFSKGR